MEVGFLLAETKGVYANLQTATFEKCIRQKCLFLGLLDLKIWQNAYNSYPAYYKIVQYYQFLWTFHRTRFIKIILHSFIPPCDNYYTTARTPSVLSLKNF